MTDDHKPLDGNTLPLGGSSANGSGGPLPPQRPRCICGDELVEQDDRRRFHLDGEPECRAPADAYARKPPGHFGLTVPGQRPSR